MNKTVLGALSPIDGPGVEADTGTPPQSDASPPASEVPMQVTSDLDYQSIGSNQASEGPRQGINKFIIIFGSLVIVFLPTPFVVWFIYHAIQNQEKPAPRKGAEQITGAAKKQGDEESSDAQKEELAKIKLENQERLDLAEAKIAEAEKTKPRVAAFDEFPEPHKSDLILEWKKELDAVRKSIAADKVALSRATSGVEGRKYQKDLSAHTERLARLLKNDPPYVTKGAAGRAAVYEEKTHGKEIAEAKAKRKAKAEAEAEAKNQMNREAYQLQLTAAKAEHAQATKIHEAKKRDYAEAMKVYETKKAEREAAILLGLARTFDNSKTFETAQRRYREVISKYPTTQAAKDAKILLEDGFVPARKTPPMPVPPTALKGLPPLVLPSEPEPAVVVYLPDPKTVAEAIASAAARSEAAMALSSGIRPEQEGEGELPAPARIEEKKTKTYTIADRIADGRESCRSRKFAAAGIFFALGFVDGGDGDPAKLTLRAECCLRLALLPKNSGWEQGFLLLMTKDGNTNAEDMQKLRAIANHSEWGRDFNRYMLQSGASAEEISRRRAQIIADHKALVVGPAQ